MVMQRGRRVLTVEEARNLLPPSEEELERRRAVLDAVRRRVEAEHCEFIARGGVPLSLEEFLEAIGRTWDDDDGDDWGDAPPPSHA